MFSGASAFLAFGVQYEPRVAEVFVFEGVQDFSSIRNQAPKKIGLEAARAKLNARSNDVFVVCKSGHDPLNIGRFASENKQGCYAVVSESHLLSSVVKVDTNETTNAALFNVSQRATAALIAFFAVVSAFVGFRRLRKQQMSADSTGQACETQPQ